MKNKLLITTALVALVSANNAFAQMSLPDLSVTDNQELTESTGVSYNTINVTKEGTLTLTGADIKTSAKDTPTTDITVNGTLNLKDGSVLEAGSDIDGLANNSNILLDGATVTMNDSDLEANGNMTIQNSTITSKSTGSTDEEKSGIWADKNLNIENSNVTLTNSYLASGGNITIQSGSINGTASSDILLSSDGKNKHKLDINGGDIILSGYSGIHSEGLEGQYNMLAADININGGDITVNDGGEITLTGNGNMNIANNANITMDYSDVTPDNAHDGGILHEGQSGDINISGGKINLTGEVAKIERGGYDGDWIYSTTGESLMSEDDFYQKTNKWFDQATDEDIRTAGLNPDEIDKNQYHVSSGDINITGGEIILKDGARISLTEKNTGDLNISGGTINGTEIGNYGKGNVNISGGEVTATDIGAEQGSITISNGTVNMVKVDGIRSEGLYARDNMTIKGGTVNISGNENLIWGKNIKMTGGTLNVKDSTAFITPNTVNIDGGTINIAENSSLGWAKASGDNFTFDTTVGENSDIDLGSNAVLNLAGTLNANIESHGTINILNSNTKIGGSAESSNGGVMNVGLNKAVIEGDMTFGASSTLNMSVTDEGNGSLTARNIVAEEGSKLALTVSKTMEIDDTATVKLFETTGKFDNNFTNEISNNRYKVEAVTEGEGDAKKYTGEYKITYENSASDVVADAGGSVNNASTAEAWDSMVKSGSANAQAKAVADVLNDLSQNNEQAYVAALTAVAPEVAPMVQKTQTETANQVFGAVGTRLTGGSISTGSEGMSSGDNIFERVAVWVQGMFNHSKLDDTSKAKGFDADSSGVAMGIEKFVTDDVKVGAGYAYTNTDIDGFMRSTDVDTHTAILYGEYKPSNWYVNGIATYGWSDYSEDRNVGGQNINADYDVETFGLQAMTGYDMQVKNFGLTPEVGLRYVHIKQDAYTDGTESDVSGNDSDILTGVIGAKVNKTFALDNGMLIKPEARIAATYDLFNDDVNSVVTLANGSAYIVEGEALDRFGMEFGAGVTTEVNDNVEFALGYEGKFREDYQDHTGLINLKYKF